MISGLPLQDDYLVVYASKLYLISNCIDGSSIGSSSISILLVPLIDANSTLLGVIPFLVCI